MRKTVRSPLRAPILPLVHLLISTLAGLCPEALGALHLDAADFGVRADGRTDDGPALARMLAATQDAHEAVTLRFSGGGTVCVRTLPRGRYLWNLRRVRDWSLEGDGTTFRLAGHLRFLNLRESRDVTVRDLCVDFDPLPFADANVVACSPDDGWLDARLTSRDPARLIGGPTRTDGEQAFFAMLWNPGPYGPISRHYWVERIEASAAAETVRVHAGASFDSWTEVVPGRTRVSLPVPGLAHRAGPGACFDLFDNTDVRVENVALWSAPWFGFRVFRNAGSVTFRDVRIEPKPGGGRLMSLWRDGFHVKGNRAALRWEDCVVTGTNDDAFNISTHSHFVRRLRSPTRIEILPRYPLNPIPWVVGDSLHAVDEATRCLRGTAVVTALQAEPRRQQGRDVAPRLTLDLDRPVPGLTVGDRVWQPASANPDTVLTRCRIEASCRFQSGVTLRNCEVTALLWCYGETIEGPYPNRVVIEDSTLRRGRGNPDFCLVVDAGPRTPADTAGPRALREVRLRGNRIHGGLRIVGAEQVVLEGNRLLEDGAPLVLRDNLRVRSLPLGRDTRRR